MSYTDVLKKTLKVLMLDGKAAMDLADSREATLYGFFTLPLVCLVTSLLAEFFYPWWSGTTLVGAAAYMLASISIFVIFFSVFHFIAAYLLGGKASFLQYFRVLSNSLLLGVMWAIPYAPVIILLWLSVVHIFILRKVHGLSLAKAVIVLMPFIAFIVYFKLI